MFDNGEMLVRLAFLYCADRVARIPTCAMGGLSPGYWPSFYSVILSVV